MLISSFLFVLNSPSSKQWYLILMKHVWFLRHLSEPFSLVNLLWHLQSSVSAVKKNINNNFERKIKICNFEWCSYKSYSYTYGNNHMFIKSSICGILEASFVSSWLDLMLPNSTYECLKHRCSSCSSLCICLLLKIKLVFFRCSICCPTDCAR